ARALLLGAAGAEAGAAGAAGAGAAAGGAGARLEEAALSPAPPAAPEEAPALAELRRRCLSPDLGDGGRPCVDCCNDGRGKSPCLDVGACAAAAQPGGRYGLVYAQVGRPGWPWLTNIGSLSKAGAKVAMELGVRVDLVLIIPSWDARGLSPEHRAHLEAWEVQVKEVEWTLPPRLKWHPRNWWPGKPDGWCGPQDLVRLHALGLEGYDAVAFYDQDVEIQGDLGPVLLCASTGKFLSTSGGAGEPLNVGFFAVRPHRRLQLAAELWAENLTFSHVDGWAGIGFLPAEDKFVGAECGQGYLHTLFYKQAAPSVSRALAAAGIAGEGGEGAVAAAQLDRCVWNYQHGPDCPPRFNCSRVVAHHNPTPRR
ncbi:unnamed protein product, partial [Prorocentrum cordatum]